MNHFAALSTIKLTFAKLSICAIAIAALTGCGTTVAQAPAQAPVTVVTTTVDDSYPRADASRPETLQRVPEIKKARIAEHFIPLEVAHTEMPQGNRGRIGWKLVALSDSPTFDTEAAAIAYAKTNQLTDLRVAKLFVQRTVEIKRGYEEMRQQNLATRHTAPITISMK